ncbi:MAG: pyrimidine 5'-nucleotidase [Parvularculaceae bacterium]
MADFTHIETWIFDLDNTLYPSDCRLFDQIDARMTDFVMAHLQIPYDEARRRQKDYYVQYGTTLNGLMRLHGVTPEAFLDHVHDIDLAPVKPNPKLAERLAALPGKRYVFTNGSVRHAENVMARLGVAEAFDDIFDIAAAGFLPKPHRAAYERFMDRHGFEAPRAAMFEDLPQNLEPPHALGMTTVLVQSAAEWLADEPAEKRPARRGETHAHVHYAVECLTTFLGEVRVAKQS